MKNTYYLSHSDTRSFDWLTAATKGKQPAKAKSPSDPSELARTEAQQLKIVLKRSRQETHISQHGGSGTDEGTETREEESFDPIPRTSEDSEDDGKDEQDQGFKYGEEEWFNEEEEADELYRDASASESAFVEEPVQTISKIEEPSHPVFETDFSHNNNLIRWREF
uniref:Uncharacterized protein n=1 Tax=Tanacetum cinerariifolium TaxID=118510 RepID=A0A6L2JBN3_TANCI|nr:hypothetical protein [Tanacetum cinerariifolium]